MGDEFALLQENADEAGLPWREPAVERQFVDVAPGQRVSALVWGTKAPELVLVHGGAQNSHTWDTVALALDRPLVAIDLPGHGHSDWRDDAMYHPRENAEALASAIGQLAPTASAVVGMSLGGLSTICLAARRPDLVRRAVLVDVTPGTDAEKAAPIAAFVNGPESFDTFEEVLERTIAFNPTRSESSLRRGVIHNTRQREDGKWIWRYDRLDKAHASTDGGPAVDFSALWDDVSAMQCTALLVRGGLSQVVGDEDEAEWRRRRPHDPVVVVDGAGHSVQGDKPVELARIIEQFVFA